MKNTFGDFVFRLMMTVMVVVLLIGCFTSCSTQKHTTSTVTVVDSTSLKVKEDSIRYYKHQVSVLLQEIKEMQYSQVLFDTVFIAGDTVVNTVIVKEDGTIEATGKIKSLTVATNKLTKLIEQKNLIIDSLSKLKQTERVEYKTKTEYKDRVIKRSFIPLWIWIVMAGLLIFSFRKQIFSLLK